MSPIKPTSVFSLWAKAGLATPDADATCETSTLRQGEGTRGGNISTLDVVIILGTSIVMGQGRLSYAEAMYKRALRSYEKALSYNRVNGHFTSTYAIQNLATLHARLGGASEAVPLYLHCQAGLEAVFSGQLDDSLSPPSSLIFIFIFIF